MSSEDQAKPWTFVTNHTQVLLCLSHDPHVRLRDVAEQVGITERAAQRILADLVEAGYVQRSRTGRRNVYTVDRDRMMRHQAQLEHPIGELLDLLEPPPDPPAEVAVEAAVAQDPGRARPSPPVLTVT